MTTGFQEMIPAEESVTILPGTNADVLHMELEAPRSIQDWLIAMDLHIILGSLVAYNACYWFFRILFPLISPT